MKEEIRLWKEFTEDQNAREKAALNDPEYPNFKEYAVYPYELNKIAYDSNVILMEIKYGIVKRNYRNFMDWLADDCPKFKGVEVKHEVVK